MKLDRDAAMLSAALQQLVVGRGSVGTVADGGHGGLERMREREWSKEEQQKDARREGRWMLL